jgi:hypothetical protein
MKISKAMEVVYAALSGLVLSGVIGGRFLQLPPCGEVECVHDQYDDIFSDRVRRFAGELHVYHSLWVVSDQILPEGVESCQYDAWARGFLTLNHASGFISGLWLELGIITLLGVVLLLDGVINVMHS